MRWWRARMVRGIVGEPAQSLDWLPKGRELLTIKKDDLADYIDGLPAMDSVAIGAQQTSALRTLS
jgi:DNA polymerase-1